ncbi:dipeptidyl aminopeptidase BI isoform X2 [Impatiens glandulifera]|uniref:dipeptidyl aminopeptidase BI isoform X2 n=1 Tax=Impatiens glandulifera TaxID=253017 RepID=UPI001FB1109D|nr:dipeptidyl aminopeptidase BI isoform X2 [Impatiens glandulifera]
MGFMVNNDRYRLYYRRVEEGKQYPVLCRRLASLNEEFISQKSPSAGFDFTTGKKIEQKLVDYNLEAERFGGYAYEELSEISPDHRLLAYTLYDKDNDFFKLCVRDLNFGSICNKPNAERVSSLAWAKNGEALLYVVTDQNKRPCRLYCSMIGSNCKDELLLEETSDNVHIGVRHTKDFKYVTVNISSPMSSQVFLINAANPLSGLTLVWECVAPANCIVEHHQGYLYLFTDAAKDGHPVDNHYLLSKAVQESLTEWKNVFVDDGDLIIDDVDFCDTHMVLIVREDRKFRLCSVPLPLPKEKGSIRLKELKPDFLPLPEHVSQISPGTNYDYYSSIMRFTVSSPLMPDAVVDYDLSNGNCKIIQQQNMLRERTKALYGNPSLAKSDVISSITISSEPEDDSHSWNDLSEFYACEYYDVSSSDGTTVPLTIVYSRAKRKEAQNPGLLHVHGAYGELLDKRWRSELKSLLDRGWVLGYADVRGGGGGGKSWHEDGRRTKKNNSINDYIACAKFLIDEKLVQENNLAGWGYSAGGLVVAAAVNSLPSLFRAVILKVPFLDPSTTLLHPILPLNPADYEEFGNPGNVDDFQAIRKYSPYDNVQEDVLYPAVMVSSSFTTRFGVWEAAKWVARIRERTIYDPNRPVLLNLTVDIVEENRYMQCKEAAMETAFLIKMMMDP